MNDWDKYDTVVDPCPSCGQEVTGYASNPEYVRSNPDSIVSIRDPNCTHETDPDADCTCTAYVNPYPNPAFDQYHQVAAGLTLTPCGCYFHHVENMNGWKITQTVKPGWHQRKLAELIKDAKKHGVVLKGVA